MVSRSCVEAKYRAMVSTVSEIMWLRWLLEDLEAPQSGPTSLYCDNQAVRHIVNNLVFRERTKHVEMYCFFVCERIESGQVQTCVISNTNQVADIFTKPLDTDKFYYLFSKFGIRDLHVPS